MLGCEHRLEARWRVLACELECKLVDAQKCELELTLVDVEKRCLQTRLLTLTIRLSSDVHHLGARAASRRVCNQKMRSIIDAIMKRRMKDNWKATSASPHRRAKDTSRVSAAASRLPIS